MKLPILRRLTQSGFSHLVIPVVVVVGVGIIGAYTVAGIHALTPGVPEAGPSPVTVRTSSSTLAVSWRAVGATMRYSVDVAGGKTTKEVSVTGTSTSFATSIVGDSGSVKVQACVPSGCGPWSTSTSFDYAAPPAIHSNPPVALASFTVSLVTSNALGSYPYQYRVKWATTGTGICTPEVRPAAGSSAAMVFTDIDNASDGSAVMNTAPTGMYAFQIVCTEPSGGVFTSYTKTVEP